MAVYEQRALVVVHPFAGFTKGQLITNASDIEAVAKNGQMSFVVATQVAGNSEVTAEEGK